MNKHIGHTTLEYAITNALEFWCYKLTNNDAGQYGTGLTEFIASRHIKQFAAVQS